MWGAVLHLRTPCADSKQIQSIKDEASASAANVIVPKLALSDIF